MFFFLQIQCHDLKHLWDHNVIILGPNLPATLPLGEQLTLQKVEGKSTTQVESKTQNWQTKKIGWWNTPLQALTLKLSYIILDELQPTGKCVTQEKMSLPKHDLPIHVIHIHVLLWSDCLNDKIWHSKGCCSLVPGNWHFCLRGLFEQDVWFVISWNVQGVNEMWHTWKVATIF